MKKSIFYKIREFTDMCNFRHLHESPNSIISHKFKNFASGQKNIHCLAETKFT